VKVGDLIHKGQVLCIVEAMKLMNEIESDVSGTVVKILLGERPAGGVRGAAVCDPHVLSHDDLQGPDRQPG